MNIASNAHSRSVLLIGGPDAGKSNFLFRLWLAIDQGHGLIAKDGLPADLDYLRAGAERLLEGHFAAHTSKEVHERVLVPVKSNRLNGGRGILVVPDVAGEQILAVYRNRQWSEAWEELISEHCACLIFIRAGSEQIVAPLDWESCFAAFGDVLPSTNAAMSTGQAIDDGRNLEPPTQVVLTEWLQFLRRAYTDVVGGSFCPRIAFVVSAWDAVPIEQQSMAPELYIRDNFPMLHQFIEANGEYFRFRTFGVSIVSGDLTNDDDFKSSYLSGRPVDFGYVFHSLSGTLERSSDVTLPVAWALGVTDDAS